MNGFVEPNLYICFGLLALALMIVIIAFFFKLLIEFLPSIVAAGVVYFITNNLIYSGITFVLVAILISALKRY
ncbi:MAG: hypothetical protein ACOC85_03710 [Thermoplasmatota archaeon]